MEKVSKVVHGIKLVERTCVKCPLTFLVPASSKQVTCGEYCFNKLSKATKNKQLKGKSKKKFTDKIKRSDYDKGIV